jgi:hypothetical protein
VCGEPQENLQLDDLKISIDKNKKPNMEIQLIVRKREAEDQVCVRTGGDRGWSKEGQRL